MEKMTVVGLRSVDFVDDNGRAVKGYSVYYTMDDPDVNGLMASKLFVQQARWDGLRVKPVPGSTYMVSYYAVGFFQAKSVGDVINYLDRDGGEIDVAYHSWVFYDPVDKSIAGVLGGDDEDEFVQEQLSLFLSQGYSVCTDGLPDDL